MKPPPFIPTGSGPLAEFARWVLGELRALQPIPAPGMLTSTGPRGVSRSTRQRPASTAAEFAVDLGLVQSVGPDSLECFLAGEGMVRTVLKPHDLRLGVTAAEYDQAVMDAFMAGYGFPGQSGTTWQHWFTHDYIMRTNSYIDLVNESGWIGGAQSRFRLVYAPLRDVTKPTGFIHHREPILEVTWPPYRAQGGGGGVGTVISEIVVGKIYGQYFDLNLDARRWKPEHEVSGESFIQMEATGDLGRLANYSPARI